MRVMLLYNPVAGAGRAEQAALELRGDLVDAGHETDLLATRLEPSKQWLDPALPEVDLLVVVGGDGAVRLASGPARRTDTPIYHFPLGTENLFAREFRFDRSPGRLLAAMERRVVERVDTGDANGRDFLLMASMGYDAEVVHDLSARRGAGISHLSYVPPMLRQLRRWRAPRLTIAVDGETIVDGETGFVVVGNSRQYAMRLDPAVRASMTDGRLDAVFFPVRTRIDLLRWMVGCRSRRHVKSERIVYRLGCEVDVQSDPPVRYQLDGDPPDPPDPPPPDTTDTAETGPTDEASLTAHLRLRVHPGVLPTLIP